MRECRIIMTTQCNLLCEYCCNNIPEVQESFKMTTLHTLLNSGPYDTYKITGGEPLLDVDKLTWICKSIRYTYPKSMVYLYTNGTLLWQSNFNFNLVHGVNVGYHGDDSVIHSTIDLSRDLPMTIHVQDIHSKYVRNIAGDKVPIREWRLNDCDRGNEDRFIL